MIAFVEIILSLIGLAILGLLAWLFLEAKNMRLRLQNLTDQSAHTMAELDKQIHVLKQRMGL